MNSTWSDKLIEWVLTYHQDITQAVWIYIIFFATIELIVHEFGHYYFQKKFGMRVLIFRIGIFKLFSQVLNSGTKVIIGIPTLMAESRCVGELHDEMKEKDNPEAFYYRHRHPREQLIVAVAGPLTTLTVCGFIGGVHYLSWLIASIPIPTYMTICLTIVAANELFNLLVPLRIYIFGTDAWVAYRAIYDWYKRPKTLAD